MHSIGLAGDQVLLTDVTGYAWAGAVLRLDVVDHVDPLDRGVRTDFAVVDAVNHLLVAFLDFKIYARIRI